MAADLHIHIFEGIDEGDLANFFSNTLGSKYSNPRPASDRRFENAYKRVADTPNIWVGEVSWLKAAVFGDELTFVPGPVQQVFEIIGEDLPVIDDELIGKISEAMRLPNATSYSLADAAEVVKFLRAHIGKKAFTVSW